MSDSIASLRRQIGNAGDLQSVVRTMKALAASNIGQYERSVSALADYYRDGGTGVECMYSWKRADDHPGGTQRPGGSEGDWRNCFRI